MGEASVRRATEMKRFAVWFASRDLRHCDDVQGTEGVVPHPLFVEVGLGVEWARPSPLDCDGESPPHAKNHDGWEPRTLQKIQTRCFLN